MEKARGKVSRQVPDFGGLDDYFVFECRFVDPTGHTVLFRRARPFSDLNPFLPPHNHELLSKRGRLPREANPTIR